VLITSPFSSFYSSPFSAIRLSFNSLFASFSPFFLFFLFFVALNAQIGIGTTSPDNSSILDISSTEKGVLLPRMTVIERLSIATPIADGLMVYQTDDVKGFYYYDSTSGSWDRVLKQTKDAIPTGSIFTFPIATPPTGYLICDGSAISRTTYAELFIVLGTTYGAGDGSTTFNLPDYRGQFLRGLNAGSGNDSDATSRQDRGDGTTGDAVGTIQNDEMGSHLHQIDAPLTASTVGGNHSHNTNNRTISTNLSGEHSHFTNSTSVGTNSTGNHTHEISGERGNISTSSFGGNPEFIVDDYGNNGPNSFDTSTSGNHNHTVNIPTLTTNNTGNHNHTVNIPTLSTNSSGNHLHTTDIPEFDSSSTGSSENRPKNIAVVYCIKF